ncbi:MAG: DUF177 domain-containing protein [Tissierellia bacterium]|nr:DUF177 domain-containing protein [Tissierellia bacterium]
MYIDISDFIANESELIYEDSGNCSIRSIDQSLEFIGDVSYDILISKADRELILNLDIEYEYKKPCDRCLVEVLNTDYVEYSGKLTNEIDVEDSGHTSDIVFMEQNKINICDLVKELVTLSIPMKNLCKDSCLGICPKCGKDLNKGECDCEIESGDLRFSVLKDLQIDEEV